MLYQETTTLCGVDVEVPVDAIWEVALEGQPVEDFLDWALEHSDVTLDQLSRYVITRLKVRDR